MTLPERLEEWDHLRGKKFVWGTQDCATSLCSFYRDVFNIELTNYARPSDWSPDEIDIFDQCYEDEGFVSLDMEKTDLVFGDLLMFGIMSQKPNHCSIYVGNGFIFHHYLNSFSDYCLYRDGWKGMGIRHLRHKDVVQPEPDAVEAISILELMAPHKRRKYEKVLADNDIEFQV